MTWLEVAALAVVTVVLAIGYALLGDEHETR